MRVLPVELGVGPGELRRGQEARQALALLGPRKVARGHGQHAAAAVLDEALLRRAHVLLALDLAPRAAREFRRAAGQKRRFTPRQLLCGCCWWWLDDGGRVEPIGFVGVVVMLEEGVLVVEGVRAAAAARPRWVVGLVAVEGADLAGLSRRVLRLCCVRIEK